MANALKFLIFYTILLGFTYTMLITGAPQIFTNNTYTAQNLTYANESLSMSNLEIFFNASTSYWWLHIFLLSPLVIGMGYIIVAWLRGTSP